MAATILIAEDYDDNRELLRLLLAGANYDVREARNGQECLTMATTDPLPDLIMVDLSMPELDGWEVFRHLKANSNTANIPRSEEHTSELQSRLHLVCRLLLEKKKKPIKPMRHLPNILSTVMI